MIVHLRREQHREGWWWTECGHLKRGLEAAGYRWFLFHLHDARSTEELCPGCVEALA